ncbi:MAG: exodeoxyribonuclease VII large subunit [Gemmatimonadaceae bacterium]
MPPRPIAEDASPGTTPATAIAISTLTRIARDVVEGAVLPLWVRGEVTDFKWHRNGHWYFCLRDRAARLRCVVWSRDQGAIPAPPDDGMQVAAEGQLTVYAARGEMQFSVRAMDAAGDGLWRKALERTRAALEVDGLLALDRKRALPRFPRRIAVVTSPSGAALHDIVAVARRRDASVRVVLIPAQVQGDGAAAELRAAIERVGRWGGADLVIIGRGGGGREDLWAFNDERLARALARCPIPTVSAVGHETDITICDLIADLRAATPSAAAEAAVPVREELRIRLGASGRALSAAADRCLARARDRMSVGRLSLVRAAAESMQRCRTRLERGAGRLNALSPLDTLGRGYAVARDSTGRTLGRVADFTPGESFDLLVRDGVVSATADAIRAEP